MSKRDAVRLAKQIGAEVEKRFGGWCVVINGKAFFTEYDAMQAQNQDTYRKPE